jgi:hypothetical protein
VNPAAGRQAPKTKVPSESAAFLARAAGVYKRQFQNGFVNGENYASEDVLEVVPIDDHAAYVRMDLEFFNGHSGRIFGVAAYGKNSLLYDNRQPGDDHCAVEYVWTDTEVITHADYEKTPGCLSYHGARGTLDGAKFSVKKRQDIRYMQRLKNSVEFKKALEDYQKSSR